MEAFGSLGVEAVPGPGNLFDPEVHEAILLGEVNDDRLVLGMQGVYKQMVEAFRSLGVEAVPGPGNLFNPEVHEAIMREENDELPDGTVLKEFRRGFRLGSQLLRAAMVQVWFCCHTIQMGCG